MSIPTDYQRLMVEWAGSRLEGHDRFIADGPLSWDHWLGADHRLIFILKEAYDTDLKITWEDQDYEKTCLGSRWTLPSLVRQLFLDGDWKPRTWQNLALWADAMHRYEPGRIPVHEIPAIDAEVLQSLRNSAVINLKKYDGKPKSSASDLAEHLRSDGGKRSNGELLVRQIQLLKPDWVVCCGTFDLLREAVGEQLGLNTPSTRGGWGVGQHNGIFWYDYWHPAWPNSPFLLANGIHAMRAIAEARTSDSLAPYENT